MSVPFSILSDVLIKNKEEKDSKNLFYEYIKKQYDLSDALFELHRKYVDQFIINHTWRWQKKSKCRLGYFHKHYGSWLNNTFELPKVTIKDAVQKDFAECSDRTKKRRGEQLRQEKTPQEIELAYLGNLSQTDKIGSQIMKSLSMISTETKEQMLELIRGNIQYEVPYSPNEALALYIDLKCTRQKYELLHSQARSRNSDLYPPYYKVLEAKKCCYPEGDIDISDLGVRIPFQSILDHTVQRLIQTLDTSLFEKINGKNLVMITKVGMDGASGQSIYKTIFKDDPGNCSDKSVFMIAMVPLRIQYPEDALWTNIHPSSTRLCRVISFEFMKEKEETTVEQYKNIEEEIKNLKPTVVNVAGKRFVVHHKVHVTMLDGKSTSYLTSTPFCNCNICGAKPSEMSDIEKIRAKRCVKENYQFGLSSLHCWIRFLECILHIAFKLEIENWKATTKAEKDSVKKRMDRIQRIYKTEKGLYLDFVRQGGGNSNDGNTARRFFRDPKYAAETTGVDETLIKRFHVILIAITSRKKVDVVKFEKYATDTIEHYNSLYSWYYMPVTVHQVLFHGAQIMEFFDLPIGYYSEEAQEARNKDFKRIRECNTRKTSRIETNEDIIHGLLISSDPVISELRNITDTKPMNFDAEVMDLFLTDTEK